MFSFHLVPSCAYGIHILPNLAQTNDQHFTYLFVPPFWFIGNAFCSNSAIFKVINILEIFEKFLKKKRSQLVCVKDLRLIQIWIV